MYVQFNTFDSYIIVHALRMIFSHFTLDPSPPRLQTYRRPCCGLYLYDQQVYQGPERELSGILINVPRQALCYKLFLVSRAVPPLSPQVGGCPGVYIYSGPIYSGHYGGCFMLVILCRIIGTGSGFLGREVAAVNYTSTSIKLCQ